jgi:sugar O-acyltransferase (sialic acid O-acetyltransferase NeuD family)
MNEFLNKFPDQVILWGGTGQAKILRPMIEYYGAEIIAIFDDTPELASPFKDIPIYQGLQEFPSWISKNQGDFGFCIAIGNPYGRIRIKLHDYLVHQGLLPITIAHPSAIIENDVIIGDGSQIMAGAILNTQVITGKQCIINTNASVDHECILGAGVEIAPGATLCGLVNVNTNGWICAGATVIPRISIGEDAIVGAGAVVIRDVPDRSVVVGIPARHLKYL